MMKAARHILLPFWAIALMLMVFSGCSKHELCEPIGDSYIEKGLAPAHQGDGNVETRGDDDGKPHDGITDDEDDEDDSQRASNR